MENKLQINPDLINVAVINGVKVSKNVLGHMKSMKKDENSTEAKRINFMEVDLNTFLNLSTLEGIDFVVGNFKNIRILDVVFNKIKFSDNAHATLFNVFRNRKDTGSYRVVTDIKKHWTTKSIKDAFESIELFKDRLSKVIVVSENDLSKERENLQRAKTNCCCYEWIDRHNVKELMSQDVDCTAGYNVILTDITNAFSIQKMLHFKEGMIVIQVRKIAGRTTFNVVTNVAINEVSEQFNYSLKGRVNKHTTENKKDI